MDLRTIEATSVAIRAGQVAAAELCNLLTREDDEPSAPIVDWFDPQLPPGKALTDELAAALQHTVEQLGGYVCHSPDPVIGERLYRWAVQENLVRRGEWADVAFGRRQAFEIFASVTRAAFTPLRAEQQRLEAIGAEPPRQLGLALEDSIMEPIGRIDELIPGGEQILAVMAGAPATPPAAPSKPAARSKPLSVGEAPPRPPVNRGGRGRTKDD